MSAQVSAPRRRWCAVPAVNAAALTDCTVHAAERMWVEKNCYIDIWLSLLHTLGLKPHACLPFVLAVDFVGDQWTFFKPAHDDLYELYGVDVQELTVWKPLIEHAREHLAAGRMISTEADAFWLPDTAGTDYRQTHTKTTVVLNELDLDRGRLGYLHNTGYHWLEGEDFDRTFRLSAAPDPTFMPLFAELVSVERLQVRPESQLREMSQALLRKYMSRVPRTNPIERFHARFREEVPALQAAGLAHYHAWAFATTRQVGAAFELAAQYLRWLSVHEHRELDEAAAAFEGIAAQNKAFILKGARLVMSKKSFQDDAMFVEAAQCWQRGMDALVAHLGG
jgi:hypothetical protein